MFFGGLGILIGPPIVRKFITLLAYKIALHVYSALFFYRPD
jgi:hypothetical protein